MGDVSSYWNRYWTRKRITRRTVIRGAGAAALATVASSTLAACGDDDDDGGKSGSTIDSSNISGGSSPAAQGTTASSPTTAAASPTAQPKKGTMWRTFINGDPATLDPHGLGSITADQVRGYTYGHLMRFKFGKGVDPSRYELEPDLAESFTTSADGLVYTVKLRKNVKWHAPVSRALEAEDIVFSWKRYTGQITGFPANASAGQLNTYVKNVEAVDPQTVKITLSEARGNFLVSEDNFVRIAPKETGTAFDPAQKMVGTGPWIFESYTAGSIIKYKRNPDWHFGPEVPYMDGIEVNIIPEYATRLNQFFAGRLDEIDVQGADLKRALETVKNMQLFIGADVLPKSMVAFQRYTGTNLPWKDVRVRRAMSMALDRNGMLDAAYSLKDLEKMNIGVQRRWHNEIPCFDTAYWLDPTGQYQAKPGDPKISDDNKLAYSYNPAEAKKLLSAAGFANGFEISLNTTRERYGQAYNIITELTQQYLSQVGITVKMNVVDYNSVFYPIYVLKHDYEGLFHVPGGPGITRNFKDYFLKTSLTNYSEIVDDQLEKDIPAMIRETDPEKRRIQVLGLQNQVNAQMYQISMPLGAVGAFLGYQPGLQNVLTHRTYDTNREQHAIPYYWRA